jgi:hypothetical protein
MVTTASTARITAVNGVTNEKAASPPMGMRTRIICSLA